jgi:hypothetical protein
LTVSMATEEMQGAGQTAASLMPGCDRVTSAPVCRHCASDRRVYRRGLCRRCHGDPAVRQLYPAVGTRADDGFGIGPGPKGGRQLAEDPTPAVPGTEEKVRVLCERARLGQVLFHPLDYPAGADGS